MFGLIYLGTFGLLVALFFRAALAASARVAWGALPVLAAAWFLLGVVRFLSLNALAEKHPACMPTDSWESIKSHLLFLPPNCPMHAGVMEPTEPLFIVMASWSLPVFAAIAVIVTVNRISSKVRKAKQSKAEANTNTIAVRPK